MTIDNGKFWIVSSAQDDRFIERDQVIDVGGLTEVVEGHLGQVWRAGGLFKIAKARIEKVEVVEQLRNYTTVRTCLWSFP